MNDPRLRYRVYVNRELVEEVWIDASAEDYLEYSARTRERHMKIIEEAAKEKKPYLVEIFDPSIEGIDSIMRIGDDRSFNPNEEAEHTGLHQGF